MDVMTNGARVGWEGFTKLRSSTVSAHSADAGRLPVRFLGMCKHSIDRVRQFLRERSYVQVVIWIGAFQAFHRVHRDENCLQIPLILNTLLLRDISIICFGHRTERN